MNKCGNCKWWGYMVPKYPGGERVMQTGDIRQCGRLKQEDSYGETLRDSIELAMVEDASGYYAALKTKADFGCNLFEEKS